MTCPRRYEQNKHATDGHSISMLKGIGRDALSGVIADHILRGTVPVAQEGRAAHASRLSRRRWKLCRRQMLSWQRRRKLLAAQCAKSRKVCLDPGGILCSLLKVS